MTTWRYIKGSEKDFEGAPDWAMFIIHSAEHDSKYAVFSVERKTKQCIYNISWKGGPRDEWYDAECSSLEEHVGREAKLKIIAQREPVTSVNKLRPRSIYNPDGTAQFGCIQTTINDNINHPLRYTKGDIECIDAIKAATVGKTGIEAVDVGHVIRYLWRYEEKDGLESVKKAEWYIKHLINELESNK